MTRPRLRVHWTDGALADLDECATAKQAARVLARMERMARSGWSYGHPAPDYGEGVRYWPVPPLGVLYKVVGAELYVVQVVDTRRLRRIP